LFWGLFLRNTGWYLGDFLFWSNKFLLLLNYEHFRNTYLSMIEHW
jgi:hypothetical protein